MPGKARPVELSTNRPDRAVLLGLTDSVSHNAVKFVRRVAEMLPRTEKVALVRDNLNTHDAGPSYENQPPQEGYSLARRSEMHYTPK